jgi:hypothetical protein
MNAINVIAPYKHHGMWVFDDLRVGLVQEPFVAGADTMIDRVVADIPNANKGFTLIFSSTPFPGHQHRLDWLRADDDGGNWYYSDELEWKAGSARRCSSTSKKRQRVFTCRRRLKPPEAARRHKGPLLRAPLATSRRCRAID